MGVLQGPEGEQLPATKLERTLIDLAVRPQYSGGVQRVLDAYKAARERASSRIIQATLKKLDYVYPYHQAIGFYMWKAGYPNAALAALRKIGFQYDFYLAQGVKTLEYVSDWRLYVPRSLA